MGVYGGDEQKSVVALRLHCAKGIPLNIAWALRGSKGSKSDGGCGSNNRSSGSSSSTSKCKQQLRPSTPQSLKVLGVGVGGAWAFVRETARDKTVHRLQHVRPKPNFLSQPSVAQGERGGGRGVKYGTKGSSQPPTDTSATALPLPLYASFPILSPPLLLLKALLLNASLPPSTLPFTGPPSHCPPSHCPPSQNPPPPLTALPFSIPSLSLPPLSIPSLPMRYIVRMIVRHGEYTGGWSQNSGHTRAQNSITAQHKHSEGTAQPVGHSQVAPQHAAADPHVALCVPRERGAHEHAQARELLPQVTQIVVRHHPPLVQALANIEPQEEGHEAVEDVG